MKDLAVDFILIPPKEIINKVIALNHQLNRDYNNSRIVLNQESYLPHISLLMGVLPKTNLPNIKRILEDIASSFSPIELTIKNLHLQDLPAKDRILKIVGLELEKSDTLQRLHEILFKKSIPSLSNDSVTGQMMYAHQEIDSEDTPWMFPYINNFRKNSSLSNFKSHITVGDGLISKPDYLPLTFITSRLALCHLGNYCTCRDILVETQLEDY